MRAQARKNRTSQSGSVASPTASSSSTSVVSDEESDCFALERQVARKTAETNTSMPSNASVLKRDRGDDIDHESLQTSDKGRTRSRTKRFEAASNKHGTPSHVTNRHGTPRTSSPTTYGRLNRSYHTSTSPLDEKLCKASAIQRQADDSSVKSEESGSTVRTSGRRTRPSARLSGCMVTHRDASEADSLSLHSSLDSYLAPNTNSTASNVSIARQTHHESTTRIVEETDCPHGADTHRDPPPHGLTTGFSVTIRSPVPGTSMSTETTRWEHESVMPSTRDQEQDSAISAPIEPDRDESLDSSLVEDHEHGAEAAAAVVLQDVQAIANRMVKTEPPPPLEETPSSTHDTPTRSASRSSFSSDLSDLSSTFSMASDESTSTTGSGTIRRIERITSCLFASSTTNTTTTTTCSGASVAAMNQAARQGYEEERRQVFQRALGLTKKWQVMWHAMDKRVKANQKKQERNRVAREQSAAAAQTAGKRKR